MKKNTSIDWLNFSISSPEFIRAIQEGSIVQLLHQYFTLNNFSNSAFVRELAEQFPEELLAGIRFNRAFLNLYHVDSLSFLKTHSNQKLSTHFIFFSILIYDYDRLLTNLEQHLKDVTNVDLIEALLITALWFEKKRVDQLNGIHNGSSHQDLNPAIEAINYFLTRFLFDKKTRLSDIKINDEEDYVKFTALLATLPRVEALYSHKVWRSLDCTESFLFHLHGAVEIYCFDHNYDITLKDSILTIHPLEFALIKRWYVESDKILAWYQFYSEAAMQIVESEIKRDSNYIKNKTGHDYKMNYHGDIRDKTSALIAMDYSIDEASLGGVSFKSVIQLLKGFVANATGRYVNPLDELHINSPKTWFRNLALNTMKWGQLGISAFPLRVLNRQELSEIISKNIPGEKDRADKLIALVSSDITSVNSLNQFKSFYSLTSKPFIQIGSHFIAFNAILGETNSSTNFLLNLMESNAKLNSHETTNTTKRMESDLAIKFRKSEILSVVHTQQYKFASGKTGDFDVLAYDKNTLLLIELKSSKFRIHLSDAHDEYENSLLKASKQLDKALKFISEEFTAFKTTVEDLKIKEQSVSELKIYTLIVTTSFERDHCLIDGKHLKITLFELQRLLEGNMGRDLQSIVDLIVQDYFWEPVNNLVSVPHVDSLIRSIKMQ